MANKLNPVDEDKVFDAMKGLKCVVDNLGLNEHERIVLLQNLLAHETNVLDRKNAATAMFAALNKFRG